jgi:hypothetical protein
MSRITEVKVNYGKTVNMGNFESMRLDLGFLVCVYIFCMTEVIYEWSNSKLC